MKTYSPIETGKRIRKLRRQAGWTQEELAERISAGRSYLGYVETGKKGCSIDALVELAQVFGVSLDYLIVGEENDIDRLKGQLDKMILQLTSMRETL